MEFKTPYQLAMREQDPKLFMQLLRHGKMAEHLQQKSLEAHAMLEALLNQLPKAERDSPVARQAAEEQVFATLIDFPKEPDPEKLEPPDDLKAPKGPPRGSPITT